MDKPDLGQLQQFVTEHDYPTDILVETLAHCNLNCTMCPQDQLTRPRGRMTFGLWQKIVDEIAEVSPTTTIWPALMGEPLIMAPEIFRWIRYAKDQGVGRVAMNSNLNLLKRAHTGPLVASGVDQVIVGLDAATPATYAAIRVNGDLDRVRTAITDLIETREALNWTTPRVTLQFIVMDENEAEEQAFVDYWQGTGLPLELKIKPRTGWGGTVPVWSGMVDGRDTERMPCTWLLRQMTVLWNGRVPQCDGDWDGKTNFGDLNRQTIGEVWNGALASIRRRHLAGDYDFAPCRQCEDWSAGLSRSVQCGETATLIGKES
jgi:sulfatase maturation enzyme AslB (radical SAM superfamily)